MKNFKEETCFTCARYSNLHLSPHLTKCDAHFTLFKHKHPVRCVHYIREPDTIIIEHENHSWIKLNTPFSHLHGVSHISVCSKCGEESIGSSNSKCYERIVTKHYKIGGIYRKSCSNEYLKKYS